MADSFSGGGYQTRGRTRKPEARKVGQKRCYEDEDPDCKEDDLEGLKGNVDEDQEEWRPRQKKSVRPRRPKCTPRRFTRTISEQSSTSDDSTGSGADRQLMRPWLIEQVDRGHIPGLVWLDAQHTLVRIPWMHGSSQKWKVNHSELFRSWAKHSNKSSLAGDDASDPKRWKANFRCALNSLPDVQEEKSKSNRKGQDAFKVYRFLPAKTRRSEIRRSEKIEKVRRKSLLEKSTSYSSQNAHHTLPCNGANMTPSKAHQFRAYPCPGPAKNTPLSGTPSAPERILPSPVLEAANLVVEREETVYTQELESHGSLVTRSPADHSYAQSDQITSTDIPTVVESFGKQQDLPAHTQGKSEFGRLPLSRSTALERVCAQYSLHIRPKQYSPTYTMDCSNSSSGDDSAFSEGCSSPTTDITDEELHEAMESFECDPTQLLNSISCGGSDVFSDDGPSVCRAAVCVNYPEYDYPLMDGFRPVQPARVDYYDQERPSVSNLLSPLRTLTPSVVP